MKYKVSVIVPVYNAALYIGKCVDSLMRQTLKEMEYIFVDDASQDNSCDVLMETLSGYPGRADDVRIVRLAEHSGVSKARNAALDIASGEFIAFCDSDDWVDERIYEILYAKAASESAEIVMCGFYLAEPDRNVLCDSKITFDGDKISQMKAFIREKDITVWRAIAAGDLYLRSGCRFPEDITITEDFHLMVRLVHESRKTCTVEDALYFYYQSNTTSLMHQMNLTKINEELRCYGQISGWIREKGLEEALRKELGWRFLMARAALVNHNFFDEARSVQPSSTKYIISAPLTLCPLKSKLKLLLTLLHLDFICRWDNHRHGRY